MKKTLSTGFDSRQYMNSGEFEVFFYNDVNLDRIVDHAHPYYEIYFFLNGDAAYQVDGIQYKLQYGDYLLIPPKVRHHPILHSTGQSYRRFVLWISESYYETMVSKAREFAYGFQYAGERRKYRFHTDFITFQEIQGRLLDLIEELHGTRTYHQLNAHLMIHSFLLFLNRITYDQQHTAPGSYENVLYLNMCDYINSHLDEDLSLDRLAAFFYSSKYHISHVFKDNMGISLHQYITKKRLQAARNGILSGIPLGEICQQCGFSDYSSFYRAFKKEFGSSPKEFKERRKLPEGY